ncbi:hypothetical protein HELRODRAFT_63928 [Helobdella robusta]|uniref:LIM zinc-binding domain-containing protein n=1 Tax=Helobdella robusta TaxID=6412 RepID=T1FXM6_HELRO|nr:hypothetical protein HELRODRAFT_63928 [Helobdella robusta]ESO06180.1 hypothetical protein HELRODRAFT_63928 [Helobdella robusta]
MCVQCNKRVYEMEKITVDTIIYHKACFRCVVCGRMLSLGNYSAMDGQMYCKTDFMKTIKMKGGLFFYLLSCRFW